MKKFPYLKLGPFGNPILFNDKWKEIAIFENGKIVNSGPAEDASNDFSDTEEVDGPVTPFNEDLNNSPVRYLDWIPF